MSSANSSAPTMSTGKGSTRRYIRITSTCTTTAHLQMRLRAFMGWIIRPITPKLPNFLCCIVPRELQRATAGVLIGSCLIVEIRGFVRASNRLARPRQSFPLPL